MRAGVYISGGATLFDLIRYAADIIRGVFGFNLDCDFHSSRLLSLVAVNALIDGGDHGTH
jgi:hypothetical protein